MMRILCFKVSGIALLCIFLMSCQGDKAQSISKPKVVVSEKDKMLKNIFSELPEACSLLDETFVSNLVGVPAANVSIKQGGTSDSVPSKSCFFKWSGGEVENAGLMVQALGNPVPDEFADWPFYFIDNKKSLGERTVSEPDKPIKFSTMQNLGDQACFSLELGKLYFRKDKTVFMVALNGIADHDKKREIFTAVGNSIIDQI